jgi:outer membrane protein insertion porin family
VFDSKNLILLISFCFLSGIALKANSNSSSFLVLKTVVPISLPNEVSNTNELSNSVSTKADDPTSLKVWTLKFNGNKTYSAIVLNAVIAHKAIPYLTKKLPGNSSVEGFDFNETELKKDEIRLKRFYVRRGFINVKVKAVVSKGEKWWQKNITFNITENNPIRIRSVVYETDNAVYDSLIFKENSIIKAQGKQPFQVGRRLESVRTQEVEGIFVKELKQLGFPFAETKVRVKTDSALLRSDVTILFKPFSLANIDSIKIIGKLSVPESYILKEAGLHLGMTFSQKTISTAQQELFNHQLFRFVTISVPNQEKDSSVSLVIRLEENKLRSIMIRGGVGTEELVRAEVAWTHLNPFGNAHNIAVRARSALNPEAELRMARLIFDYNIPYFFNTRSGTRTSPFIEYKNEYSYRLGRFGLNNSFLYQHSKELQSIVSYEYTVNRTADKTTRTVSRDSLELYNISSLQFASFFRKGFLDRELGWYVNPNIEFSGIGGLGTYRYDKIFLDLRRYFRLSKTLQFAFKTHLGFINVKKADDIPAAVRLYAGGTSSVRGWLLEDLGPKRVRFNDDGSFDRYVPIGGKALFSFSAEFRKQINFPFKGLGFATFLDGGQIWRGINDIDIMRSFGFSTDVIEGTEHSGVQYGVGGGLSYDTPIGPIRIDLAYKLNPTQADLAIFEGRSYAGPIKRWAIHFSIGHPF